MTLTNHQWCLVLQTCSFLVYVIRTCGDSEFEIAGILRERWGSLAVCMYFAPFLQNRAMETVQLGIL